VQPLRVLGTADRQSRTPLTLATGIRAFGPLHLNRLALRKQARPLKSVEFFRMDHIPSVGSVMTPFPHVVQVDESVMTAKALMVEHDVRHLPVKDGNTLLGVLTDRDLKRALDPSLGLPPKEELFVRDVFVPDAYVVDVAEPLDGVLEHLSTEHIGSALVTKHGRLVGILTLTDAARIFCRHLRALFPSASADEVA